MTVGNATIIRTDVTGPSELMARLIASAANAGSTQVTELNEGLTLISPSALAAMICAKQIERETEYFYAAPTASVGVSAGEPENGVDLASSLCSKAESGQVLVTDRVHSLVGDHGGDDFREVARVGMQGIGAPVRAWELLWRQAEPRTKIRLCGSLSVKIDGRHLDRGPPPVRPAYCSAICLPTASGR